VIGLAHQIRRSKNDSEKTQTSDHLMGARLSNLADIGAGVISESRRKTSGIEADARFKRRNAQRRPSGV
jgi:hypothetical protein